nr:MAG TPA: hypothetical protein [Caudoviricetes sp.]
MNLIHVSRYYLNYFQLFFCFIKNHLNYFHI